MIVVAIFLQVLIQIMKRNLVGRLVLPILVTVLLHRVISQMDELIHIFGAVFLAAGPHISFPIKPYTIVRV